jgi:acyl-homoserine lactone acylase PvdQ
LFLPSISSVLIADLGASSTKTGGRLMRWIVLLALGVALAGALPAAAQAPSSASHREVAVPGLDKPVDIVVDQWGIAHIYAASTQDAFFAQGYNAARDRLWHAARVGVLWA